MHTKQISAPAFEARKLDQVCDPARYQGVGRILAEIIQEVEARGPEGHWLSRGSPLLARARLALVSEMCPQDGAFVRVEAALRDLVGRVEDVKTMLSRDEPAVEPATLAALLDTTDARTALGNGEFRPAAGASVGG